MIKGLSGLTFIELLVSLTIASLIFSLMLNLYITAKHNYDLYLAQHALQKNEKLAVRILKDDIRLAGYLGCPKLDKDLVSSSDPNCMVTPENKLILSAESIIVRHASKDMATLTAPIYNENQIEINHTLNIKKGDVLLVSDCQSADIFRVESVGEHEKKQIIFSDRPIYHAYGKGAELSYFLINQYFIKNTRRKDIAGKPIYALFRKNIRGESEEVVTGVNKMVVEDGRKDFRSGLFIKLTVVASPFEKEWPLYIPT